MEPMLPCPSGHEMRFTTLGELMQSGGVGYSGGFVCDGCNVSHRSPSDRTLHCAACNYDLCSTCAASRSGRLTCGGGHPLVPAHSADLFAETRDYAVGYTCDVCGVSKQQYPIRHCAACRYDVCPSCVSNALGYGGSGDDVGPIRSPPQPLQPPIRHLAGRPAPPRHHLAGKVAVRPPRFAGSIARPIEPVPVPVPMPMPVPIPQAPPQQANDDGNGVSHEWRTILNSAGITEASLRDEQVRQFVFETVRGLIPDARRPARLTSLPPIATLGCSSNDAMMTLKTSFQFFSRR